jgi:hypothetical protein
MGPGKQDVPQGLKPKYRSLFTERLKSFPDTKQCFSEVLMPNIVRHLWNDLIQNSVFPQSVMPVPFGCFGQAAKPPGLKKRDLGYPLQSEDRGKGPNRENMRSAMHYVITAGAIALGSSSVAATAANVFGSANPFYAPSTLPFQAPPFEKIQDSDYQPAIEAGM